MVNDFMMDWKGGGTHICAVNKNGLEKQKSVSLVQHILVQQENICISLKKKYVDGLHVYNPFKRSEIKEQFVYFLSYI